MAPVSVNKQTPNHFQNLKLFYNLPELQQFKPNHFQTLTQMVLFNDNHENTAYPWMDGWIEGPDKIV